MLIHLETQINAPIERVFNLGRSLDLHKEVNSDNHEKIIEGRVNGLVEKGDIITWQAKHFGVMQKLKVVVDQLEAPFIFHDQMLTGAFKTMEHTHQFESNNAGTLMTDKFIFSSPYGRIGKLIDRCVLSNYLTRFLKRKNRYLKQVAESDDYMKYLNQSI